MHERMAFWIWSGTEFCVGWLLSPRNDVSQFFGTFLFPHCNGGFCFCFNNSIRVNDKKHFNANLKWIHGSNTLWLHHSHRSQWFDGKKEWWWRWQPKKKLELVSCGKVIRMWVSTKYTRNSPFRIHIHAKYSQKILKLKWSTHMSMFCVQFEVEWLHCIASHQICRWRLCPCEPHVLHVMKFFFSILTFSMNNNSRNKITRTLDLRGLWITKDVD